jgi:hypothetical protein
VQLPMHADRMVWITFKLLYCAVPCRPVPCRAVWCIVVPCCVLCRLVPVRRLPTSCCWPGLRTQWEGRSTHCTSRWAVCQTVRLTQCALLLWCSGSEQGWATAVAAAAAAATDVYSSTASRTSTMYRHVKRHESQDSPNSTAMLGWGCLSHVTFVACVWYAIAGRGVREGVDASHPHDQWRCGVGQRQCNTGTHS